MAIFKKLNIGDTVATSGTRVFKKLTTESKTYPVSGTWLFNEVLQFEHLNGILEENVSFSVFTDDGTELPFGAISIEKLNGEEYYALGYLFFGVGTLGKNVYYADIGKWSNDYYREITITEVAYVSEGFYKWFTANAVNMSVINGTYLFNGAITEMPIVNADAEELDDKTGVMVNFLDSELMEGTCIMMSDNKLYYYHFLPIDVYSYDTNSWNYERSRFVTFNNALAKNYNGEDVTPIFCKWLATNTVKQGQITFTIDGIPYTADEGTRWGHWLKSTHNTDNFTNSFGGDNVWTGFFAERNALVSTDGENLVTTKDAIIAGYNYVLVDNSQ